MAILFTFIILLLWIYSVIKEKDDMILEWHVYSSKRFIIRGNTLWCLYITDLKTNIRYTLQHSELVKFRKHFDNMKHKNKDSFILTTILHKKGTISLKSVA